MVSEDCTENCIAVNAARATEVKLCTIIPVQVARAFEIALGHHREQRLAEAEAIYREILTVDSRNAPALHLIGLIAHQRGNHELAVELIGKAIAINPREPAYHSNVAEALRQLGKIELAITACERAISLNPNWAEAYSNLGNALLDSRRLDKAAVAYTRALRLNPNLARTRSNLGNVLRDIGNADAAIQECSAAIAIDPNLAEAHCNLANALRDRNRLDEAVASYHRAIAIDPTLSRAHCNLGTALLYQYHFDLAISAYRRAIEIDPKSGLACSNLANAFSELGLLDESLRWHAAAAALCPDDSIIESNRLFTLQHHAGLRPEQVHAEHVRWGNRFALPLRDQGSGFRQHDGPANRRLRVGYVSGDFRQHPVGQFILPLLSSHDPGVVEVFCYSNVAVPDSLTRIATAHAHAWRNIFGLSDDRAAEMIQHDRIDILIDLSQHTAANRLPVFAKRPAPIQVSYLGSAGTTGMPTIDYRLTDRFADPPGLTEQLFTESLWRLPNTAWCFAEPSDCPLVQPPPSSLRSGVTFGCFNRASKLDHRTMQLWAAILRAVPESRLLLKDGAFQSSEAVSRFAACFVEHGIRPDRVGFRGRDSDMATHLKQYSEVDVALDPTHYNGTTTTCEALWMGVPVVTLAGQTHASRVGVSLLSNAGLPEMVACDGAEYVRVATALAADPQRLDELRFSMRDRLRASPLMDATRFARDVEEAYREMWQRRCNQGVAP
jgi:predicted O-linked N-acetylglucosamine transferase (SPINDLY family)